MLSVEDPKDPDNDLAKGSFNAPRIRQVNHQFVMQQAHRTWHLQHVMLCYTWRRLMYAWILGTHTADTPASYGAVAQFASTPAIALQAFDYAYTQLARGGSPDDSLLARVIRLDTVLTDRPQPPPLPDYVDGAQSVRRCCQLPLAEI